MIKRPYSPGVAKLQDVKTFPPKQFQGKYCLSPFVMIEVTIEGDVRMCGCGGWMPTTIGNLKETTLKEMLHSDLAQKIRQSIIDGSYVYCNEKLCGVIANNSLNTINTVPANIRELFDDPAKFEMPHHISFQGDETCNLSCPSCRTKIIKTPKEQQAEQLRIGEIVSNNLFHQASDKKIKLECSGTGEVFASPMLMNFINSIDCSKFPNLELDIGTNGLMCEQNWHRLGDKHRAIKKITVSIDASQAGTYEKLRRGGKWPKILEAMKFLQSKKHELGFALHTRIIVQQQNYTQMESFYNLCQTFDVDTVEYSRVTNWGTWNFLEFNSQDVLNPVHPEYELAQAELARVKKLSGTWFAGM
jgi:MoaA/NifB/PqqE/SkfB family radical SAM enzyme